MDGAIRYSEFVSKLILAGTNTFNSERNQGFNCVENLPEICSKTIVIYGEENLLIPREESAGLLRAIPGVVQSIIDQAAYAVHMDNPREFINAVRVFLV